MAERGHELRRRLSSVALLTVVLVALSSLLPVAASASPWRKSWTSGEHGSGPPAFRSHVTRAERLMMPSQTWVDLEADDLWAKAAIEHVAGTYEWMRDVPPDANGNWRFRPDAIATRQRWARSLVLAFAPDAEPDPSITFTDMDAASPYHRWAAVAVQNGWLGRSRDGRFSPTAPVTAKGLHRSLVYALGMRSTARALDGLATTDGYVFATPRYFGVNLLALRLGLRFNNKSDESQDVTPNTALRRKQVAWSLYRATTLEDWVVPSLEDQYAGMVLPRMSAARRAVVDWGVRYVGYPYIWAGEWGFASPSPPAFGSQPGPGFDCSGLSWWALRRDEGPWQISPPRPYRGWPLPQRTSSEMARWTKTRIRFADLRPGDLMFYDGDSNGTVDHVDVYVGNGWALDSSSSIAGVTLMWVRTGWYRQHFVHGRRILRS